MKKQFIESKSTVLAAVFALAAIFTINSQLSIAVAQGSLTPPAEAPAPVMKSLDQIEPRTPLNSSTAPGDAANAFIITQPGSYYLTGNLEVTNATAISIRTNQVKLDLMGFEIRRQSGTGDYAIYLQPGRDGCAVGNGSLRGFNFGVYADGFPRGLGGRLKQLSISGCTSGGIIAGIGWIIEDCMVYRCIAPAAFSGILANDYSLLSRCTVVSNSATSSFTGIFVGHAGTVSDCVASANSGGEAVVGIAGDIGSSVFNCNAEANTSFGLSAAGISHNGNGIVKGCVSRGQSANNGVNPTQVGVGFDLQSGVRISACQASDNQGDGIRAMSKCVIERCTASNNGLGGDGAGIHTTASQLQCVIDGNVVIGNDRGIDVDGSRNVIVRNSASVNTTNYDIASDNRYGAIVNISAPGGAAASGSSAASTLTSTDPWANLAY